MRHAILLGTIRESRFGEKPASWLCRLAQGRQRADYELVDLHDYPLPLFSDATLPTRGQGETELGNRWRAILGGFDGFVFVTAEYNHGISGALKNALDYVYPELNRKPAAFLGYGGTGGARAVEQLRLTLVEFQMAPIRTAVHIGMPDFGDLSQGRKVFEDFPHLTKGANVMPDDLEWWSDALATARDPSRHLGPSGGREQAR